MTMNLPLLDAVVKSAERHKSKSGERKIDFEDEQPSCE